MLYDTDLFIRRIPYGFRSRGLSDFLHRYIPEIEKEMFEFLPIQEPEAFLYAPIRDYPERGGKRFRPALVLLACQVLMAT